MISPIHILLIEDNPADADLTCEVLSARFKVELSVAKDSIEALEFLHGAGSWSEGFPTLILLNLNLPRNDGRQLLAILKGDELFRHIPVVVLSSSDSEKDITSCYHLGANSYITKPNDLQGYRAMVHALEAFWLGNVKLPRRDGHSMATRIGYGLTG